MDANPALKRALRQLVIRVKKALEDPSALMKQLGGLLIAQSGKAFDQSRLGEWIWPRRYPNQGEGDRFVNIAGVVSDFSQGKEPPLRRFQARPPLLDTGYMRRTIKDKSKSLRILGTHTVEAGTTDPRAGAHQWGGQSEQFITDTVRDNAKTWLAGGPDWHRTKTKVKKWKMDLGVFGVHEGEKRTTKRYEPETRTLKTDRGTGYIGTLTRRERFGGRLSFLFRSRVLITKINQRPFLGVSDEYKIKMVQTVEDWFGGKAKATVRQ